MALLFTLAGSVAAKDDPLTALGLTMGESKESVLKKYEDAGIKIKKTVVESYISFNNNLVNSECGESSVSFNDDNELIAISCHHSFHFRNIDEELTLLFEISRALSEQFDNTPEMRSNYNTDPLKDYFVNMKYNARKYEAMIQISNLCQYETEDIPCIEDDAFFFELHYDKLPEIQIPEYVDKQNIYISAFEQSNENIDLTIESLTKAIAEAYYNRGLAYLNSGDYDKAITDFNKAIELNPVYVDAYYYRGLAYQFGENYPNYDKAITDFNNAIGLNPVYVDAYYYRGSAYYHKRDFDRAITDFNKAIGLNPVYVDAYYYRGSAYYFKDDFDRAITDYSKVIELNPVYVDAYYYRGLAYHFKDDDDSAITDYSKWIELKPEDARAYYFRGYTYSDKGDYDRAIKDLQKYLELNPTAEDRERVLRRIYELENSSNSVGGISKPPKPSAPGGLAARCCTRTQATSGATKTCTTAGHSYTCNCGSGACW
jgi:tetratricopeptide (TPR) repeat protein